MLEADATVKELDDDRLGGKPTIAGYLQAPGVVAALGLWVCIAQRAAPSQRPARSHPIGSYLRHLVSTAFRQGLDDDECLGIGKFVGDGEMDLGDMP